MKSLQLNEIKKIIGVPLSDYNPEIRMVSNSIAKLGSNTVVFHLNRVTEVNIGTIKDLKDIYIVTDQPIISEWKAYSDKFLFVNNVYRAYLDFISFYRQLFNIPVIAVTGTNGKSTVKEMITQVLRRKYNVVANKRSRNNPSYNHEHLMMFNDKTQFVVIETAIGAPGNLSNSCDTFKPTIGIITNIGIDHLESCKTPTNYLRTKGEMLAGLNYQGTLIINGDDINIKKLDLSPFKGKVIRFGFSKDNDYQATNIQYINNGMEFTLIVKGKSYPVFVPGFGEHNVQNALASFATFDILGINLIEAINYLKKFNHLRSHLAVHYGPKNSILIDDTWHINMKGVEAALKVTNDIGWNKTKIVVFGRFDDYGKQIDFYYDTIAKWLIEYKIDYFISIDPSIRQVGIKATKLGFNSLQHIYCPKSEDLIRTLNTLCDEHSIVLLKEAMYHQSLKQILPRLIIK